MKPTLALAAALLALAACQPAAAPDQQAATPEQPGAAAGCNARAEAPWGPVGASDHASYRIEAYAHGGICEASVVTLVIRARDGFPAYVWAGAAQHLFGLAGQPDTAAMNKALTEWMNPASGPQTTAELPPWDQTEGQPNRAEFPFMPAEWIDQATYDAMRAEKLTAYCFPQGMESLNCVALRDGQIEDIGLQLFPG